MSDWQIYRGDQEIRVANIPPAPPWRTFATDVEPVGAPPPADSDAGATYIADGAVVDCVNAALRLRRPLLLTGDPGSGKSSLIDAVARELGLGRVLRWHVTSRSTLADALYRYDAIGRMQAHAIDPTTVIDDFLRLGPLGTALVPRARPRALLVDEIDKSDIDLPNDLLNVFERGEFEIPELARHKDAVANIREYEEDGRVAIKGGRVRCLEFPFVVLTSNGERDFPPAFLRRCIRLEMPTPDSKTLERIVSANLGTTDITAAADLIARFVGDRDNRATDQLINAAYLVTQQVLPNDEEKTKAILDVLLKELTLDA